MVNLFIANTDNGWFDSLASEPNLKEVNFWWPGEMTFRAIEPGAFGEGGFHSKSNGILLRKDIHSVFDAGYATVDVNYRFVVSRKVKEVFNNGEEYLRLDGKILRLPKQKPDWPNTDFLRWHNLNRFLS